MTLDYDMERLKVLCDQMGGTFKAIWPNSARLPEWKRHRLMRLAGEVRAFKRDVWPVPPGDGTEAGRKT